MTGQHLGKWVLVKQLGRGGMGQVYLARDDSTGKEAALKVLNAELAQDAGFLQRFQREMEILQKLSHPNIVQFYEAGVDNNVYFYVMEYIEGACLDDILHERGRLP